MAKIEYRSPIRIIRSGPSIKVKIFCLSNAIEEVIISSTKEKGLLWQVISDNSPPQQSFLSHISLWLENYCLKTPLAQIPTVSFQLTPFQSQALGIISEIPFGRWISYQDLATKLNSPKGARAAGAACGKNPVPLFIPCHRILASTGKLGGFTGGLEAKRRLLEFENISFTN